MTDSRLTLTDKQTNNKERTRPYTRAEVACGWAGAVMIKAYPSIWAGAVTQKPPVTPKKQSVTDPPTDTDRQTDRVGHRVACTRLKRTKMRERRLT